MSFIKSIALKAASKMSFSAIFKLVRIETICIANTPALNMITTESTDPIENNAYCELG